MRGARNDGHVDRFTVMRIDEVPRAKQMPFGLRLHQRHHDQYRKVPWFARGGGLRQPPGPSTSPGLPSPLCQRAVTMTA